MSKRSNRKDVDDLLADLDNLGTEQPPTKPPRKSADKSSSATATASIDTSSGAGSKKAPEDADAQSLLDDLDSLVQSRAASSSRASLRKKDDTASATPSAAVTAAVTKSETDSSSAAPEAPAAAVSEKAAAQETILPASNSSGGGWAGWGSSLFSQATKLADQARQEFEKRAPTQAEQARELGSKGWDLAKGVRGFVKESGLEKWGKYHLHLDMAGLRFQRS